MREAVSDILVERSRVADGMSRMFAVSLMAHAALFAVLALAPSGWSSRARDDGPIMTISLGGTEGPDTPGLTSISERPVQRVAEPNEKPVDAAPAPKAPEMVEPTPVAKPMARTKPVEKPVDKSSTRRATAGEEVKTGDARVKTGGAVIPFGGLATGGGGDSGVRLDVQNFCCPDYIQTMVQRIRQSWNANQGAAGQVGVKFTIRRDGMLTNVEVEEPSGQSMLDLESRRAVLMTRQLPPLPPEFTPPNLTVHMTFNYRR
ncbi:MAG: TonB family protein [Vicinamibacterales bacterium]